MAGARHPWFFRHAAVDGKIVFSEGFGYADLEQPVPVLWPATKFRFGSVSKPLTAAALVELVEQGKLDLDAPIQKYVPSFPDKGAVITSRMLAGHLGGIRHYKDNEFFNSQHYDNVVAGLGIFQDDPLVSPPGTKFNYSSYGFNLLSVAIEKACAEDFLSCMRDLVFSPLGLRSTVADQPSELIEQRARFYTHWKDKPLENSPYTDNSYKWAGGGFLSTSEDLVQFGNALLEPGYLKKESLALLFTSQKTKAAKRLATAWVGGSRNQSICLAPNRLRPDKFGDVRALTQFLLHVAAERIEINVLGSQAVSAVFAIHPSASLRLPYPNPIRRPIAGAAESAGVHQSLQQKWPMAIAQLPVTGKLTCALR